jgi:hypothetical protein
MPTGHGAEVSRLIAPPSPGHTSGTSLLADAHALFAEARRRRRRIRLAAAAACLLAAAGAAAGITVSRPGTPQPRSVSRQPAAAAHVPEFSLSPAAVAWVDSGGGLHVGNVSNLHQRVAATVNSDNQVLIETTGRIYWADGQSIRALELATGARWRVATGKWASLSADRRQLYVATGTVHGNYPRALTVVPVSGRGPARPLTLPAGWRLSNYPDAAVAGGLVVESYPGLGIWTERTGRVRVLSRKASVVIGSWTPRGADHSLLAWEPGGCRVWHCPLEITNTGTMRTMTVRSPLRYGFMISQSGAAFSPDGTTLAAFASATYPLAGAGPESELTLINTRTGAVQLVPSVRLLTTEDAAWVAWLPRGEQLLAGAISANYAVNAVTLATRPFYFFGPAELGSPDISFSAIALPASALSTRIRAEIGLGS